MILKFSSGALIHQLPALGTPPKNKPTKPCAEHPGLLQAVASGQCCLPASPAGLARKKPDETLACPARSRLHGGKRQQAAAVQGLRREFRPNARLFLAESLSPADSEAVARDGVNFPCGDGGLEGFVGDEACLVRMAHKAAFEQNCGVADGAVKRGNWGKEYQRDR